MDTIHTVSTKNQQRKPMEKHTIQCQNAGICGGCFYTGIPYEEELKQKEAQVRELLRPVIRTDFCYEPILPSPKIFRYRNKMEFSFGDMVKDGPLTLGLHQKKSFYNIVNADGCELCDPDFSTILRETREYFSALGLPYFHKRSHEGYLRHLLIRRAERTGEILVDLVTCSGQGAGEKKILQDWCRLLLSLEKSGEIQGKLSCILHTKNDALADAIKDEGTELLYGQPYFKEELLGLQFRISPFSFFQTNSLGAERLYQKVMNYASSGIHTESGRKPVIYDLFSGTGTITQLMSRVASQSIGVEIVEEAVEAARENSLRNGIENCAFIAGDVLKVIEEGGQLRKEDGSFMDAPRPDLIILDPPRDGIHPKALRKIIDYAVETLVYVACKPKSLARDLVPLQEAGYHVVKAGCVDMFPHTNNVEAVALLSHKAPDSHIHVKAESGEGIFIPHR